MHHADGSHHPQRLQRDDELRVILQIETHSVARPHPVVDQPHRHGVRHSVELAMRERLVEEVDRRPVWPLVDANLEYLHAVTRPGHIGGGDAGGIEGGPGPRGHVIGRRIHRSGAEPLAIGRNDLAAEPLDLVLVTGHDLPHDLV